MAFKQIRNCNWSWLQVREPGAVNLELAGSSCAEIARILSQSNFEYWSSSISFLRWKIILSRQRLINFCKGMCFYCRKFGDGVIILCQAAFVSSFIYINSLTYSVVHVFNCQ